MIRAAFFDFDNTLYSHETNRIPSDALTALHALQEKGILTYLCTVRHISELDALSLPLLPLSGYVVLDGQLCLDAERRAFAGTPIPREDIQSIIPLFLQKKTALKLVEEKDCYINVINDYVRTAQASIGADLPPLGKWRAGSVYQVCLFGNCEDVREVMRHMPHCRMTRWHDVSVDIYSQYGGKVHGIKKVLSHHGIAPEEIIAFGDEKNDVEMLKFAGIGVAMGNGTEEAKVAADWVTDAVDEGGIVNALKHFEIL